MKEPHFSTLLNMADDSVRFENSYAEFENSLFKNLLFQDESQLLTKPSFTKSWQIGKSKKPELIQ